MCWRGKKKSMLQPCVRSMLCRRRVGGGERSSEIIHWIMGRTPVAVHCAMRIYCMRLCAYLSYTYPRDPRARARC